MTGPDVIAVLNTLERASVPAWLDGGWGVDALLHRQTRPHDDLDLVIDITRLGSALRALESLGFSVDDDERPTRVAMHGSDGRAVDLHLVSFTADGDGIQVLQDSAAFCYRAAGFRGIGRIDGQDVSCLDVDVQVECHLGYEPDADDVADMQALAAKFKFALPAPYAPAEP